MAQPGERKLVNFDGMSKGALLRYEAMYKLEGTSEEDIKTRVMNHFLNTLEVDSTKLVSEILAMGRDQEEKNKRYPLAFNTRFSDRVKEKEKEKEKNKKEILKYN